MQAECPTDRGYIKFNTTSSSLEYVAALSVRLRSLEIRLSLPAPPDDTHRTSAAFSETQWSINSGRRIYLLQTMHSFAIVAAEWTRSAWTQCGKNPKERDQLVQAH